MGFNFPNAPITGQLYPAVVTPGLPQYRFDGEKWKTIVAVAATASVFISDTAPAAPVDGMLWWESDTGNLYVRYNDGDSTQWVICGQFGSLSGLVRYDVAQGLTDTQKQQARQNIYAAPFDALAYNGMQVNGACDVSQERARDITFPLTSGAIAYACDGWAVSHQSSIAAMTASPGTIAGFGAPLLGYKNLVYLQANPGMTSLANGDYALFRMLVEGYRWARLGFGAAGAMPFSFGFYIYVPRSGAIIVRPGSISANRAYVMEKTVTGGAWNWITGTVPGDTTGAWNADNMAGMMLDIMVSGQHSTIAPLNTWSSSFAFYTPNLTNQFLVNGAAVGITGLVIVPGTEVPPASRAPFIMRPYDQELAICQRYWRASYDTADKPGTVTQAGAHRERAVTPLDHFSILLDTRMRTAPTLTFYNPATGAAGSMRNNSTNVDLTVALGVASNGGFTWSITAGAVAVGDLITGHWVADARL